MPMVDMNVYGDESTYPAPHEPSAAPCVYLNEAQCKALGITQPLRAGTTIMVHAQAMVESVTESTDGDEDDPDVRMTLCLTHMELHSAEAPKDPASGLYGS